MKLRVPDDIDGFTQFLNKLKEQTDISILDDTMNSEMSDTVQVDAVKYVSFARCRTNCKYFTTIEKTSQRKRLQRLGKQV